MSTDTLEGEESYDIFFKVKTPKGTGRTFKKNVPTKKDAVLFVMNEMKPAGYEGFLLIDATGEEIDGEKVNE